MKAFFWALAIIFRLEGGWYEGDGGTNYGIRAATLSSANKLGIVRTQDVRKITRREAAQIYYEMYWKKSGAYRYSPPLNLVIFDAAVHSGPDKAKELLTTAIRKSYSTDPKRVALSFVVERYKHLKSLPKFPERPGWRKRMNTILRYVMNSERKEQKTNR